MAKCCLQLNIPPGKTFQGQSEFNTSFELWRFCVQNREKRTIVICPCLHYSRLIIQKSDRPKVLTGERAKQYICISLQIASCQPRGEVTDNRTLPQKLCQSRMTKRMHAHPSPILSLKRRSQSTFDSSLLLFCLHTMTIYYQQVSVFNFVVIWQYYKEDKYPIT